MIGGLDFIANFRKRNSMDQRHFLAGVAVGLIIATISSYYFFCRPDAQETKTGAGSPMPVLVAGPVPVNWPSGP